MAAASRRVAAQIITVHPPTVPRLPACSGYATETAAHHAAPIAAVNSESLHPGALSEDKAATAAVWGRLMAGWRRWLGLAAIIGGALWCLYRVFEMLSPLGVARAYDDEVQYDRVLNSSLYRLYFGVGSTSVALLSVVLLAISGLGVRRRLLRVGQVIGVISLLFGTIGFVGAMLLATILAGAGTLMGSAVLGVGNFLVVLGLGRRPERRVRIVMIALGVIGLTILPLRPLVNAFALFPPNVAVMIMVAWGVLWGVAGVLLSRTSTSVAKRATFESA
jgi:hypothetical protein